jgi:hypothetical protein
MGPLHMLIAIHFYRYEDRSRPPCGELCPDFITNDITSRVISKKQLEDSKRPVHSDPGCKRTSVHFNQSVARPDARDSWSTSLYGAPGMTLVDVY